MSEEKKGVLIPFIREKDTRGIVKSQFEDADSKKKRLVDTFNKALDAEFNRVDAEIIPTLDEATLEKEYRRKQDEMRKKREQNNRDVTRSYRLHHKPDGKR